MSYRLSDHACGQGAGSFADRRLRSQRGFNLIELVVVIVIIGILTVIALPNFYSAQDRARISGLKTNMHTFQTLLESYAIDWGGVYPGDCASLQRDGSEPGRAYWKDFANPFTGTTGPGQSYADAASLPLPAPSQAGLVLYNPGGQPIMAYFIYGLDKNGEPVRDKGQAFMLSNS